jgi:hypothetical protein
VFEFIIPVYRASKRMKQEVSQMQQKMQEHQRQQQPTRQETFANSHSTSSKPDRNKDYIEFEELK